MTDYLAPKGSTTEIVCRLCGSSVAVPAQMVGWDLECISPKVHRLHGRKTPHKRTSPIPIR